MNCFRRRCGVFAAFPSGTGATAGQCRPCYCQNNDGVNILIHPVHYQEEMFAYGAATSCVQPLPAFPCGLKIRVLLLVYCLPFFVLSNSLGTKLKAHKTSYRGADRPLARPGRKQARKHVRDARDFNKIETRAVIKFLFLQGKVLKEIHAFLTEKLAFFFPGRAKDLSAPLYIQYRYLFPITHFFSANV